MARDFLLGQAMRPLHELVRIGGGLLQFLKRAVSSEATPARLPVRLDALAKT